MLTEFLRSFTLPGLEKKYIVADDSLTEEGAAADSKKVGQELAKKVDKETGKALSTNDYTNAEKTKLAGVASGAQVNTIEGVKVDGTEVTPDAQKKVNLNVYDKAAIDAIVQAIYAEVAKKLNIDGYSELATVGNALGLVTDSVVEDKEPYNFRSLAHLPVGKFCYDTIVGGSIVWNQLIEDGNFTDATKWTHNAYTTFTTSNNVGTVTVNDITTNNRPSITPPQPTAPIVGHKYLIAVDAKFNTNVSLIGFSVLYGDNVSFGNVAGGSNTWNSYRKILNCSSTSYTSGTLYISQYLTSFSVGDTLHYRNYNIIDLTAELTPTIADYIYSLEQTTAGAGVAWFKKYFPAVYYGYAEPHFEHVQVSAKNTVGFNQFDKDNANKVVGGYINDGKITGVTSGRVVVYIPCLPNTTYCASRKAVLTSERFYIGYTKELPAVGVDIYGVSSASTSQTVGNTMTLTTTTGADAKYIAIWAYWDNRTDALDTLCISFSSDRNGEYEPYKKRTYPLDSSLTLRGIPKLDSANRLYFDGDIYRHDGSGEQRFDLVDMGTLTYTYTSGVFRFTLSAIGAKAPSNAYVYPNALCQKYTSVPSSVEDFNGSFKFHPTSGYGYIADSNYTDAASFKTAMSGVYLLYEKTTPEPFTAEPFQSPMVVDPLGMEEFVDYAVEQGERDVKIPCGHTSEYPEDLVDKLEVLPHATGTNGDFLITEIDGRLYLKPYTQTVGLTSVSETEAE